MAWGKRKRKRPRGGGVGVRDANDEASSGGGKHVSPPGANGGTAASASASASADVISSEDDVRIDVVDLALDQIPKNSDRRRRIRVVRPYPYTFATYAKQRWIGRTILDVYVDEFGSYPESYYRSAIEGGRITVSGRKVGVEYRIRGGDELNHSVHRHEPAVAVADLEDDDDEAESKEESPDDRNRRLVKVVHEDGDVIAVDKPATMPVHPCGGYNFNSLFHVLARQDPKLSGSLRAVHRLDRLTSGLVLVAKGGEVAKRLGKCLSGRSCEKLYLTRVRGKFPLNADPTLRFPDCSTRGVPCSYGEVLPIVGGGGEAISSPSEAVDVEGNGSSSPPKSSSDAGTVSGEDVGQGKKRRAVGDVCHVGNGGGGAPALGFWITEHESAEPVDDEVSLRNVFSSSAATTAGDVASMLSHLLRTEGDGGRALPGAAAPSPTRGTENSTAAAGLDGRTNFWLNLACPCRISDPKKGVCEAGGHLLAAAVTPPSTDATVPTSKPPNGKKNKNSNSGSARKNNGVKPAQTAFAVLGYDPITDSTLVLARPATGRTHQIRLHLQFLGHPIANDPNYGGELFYGDPDGRRASEEARKRLDELDRVAAAVAAADCEGSRGVPGDEPSATGYAPPPENSTSTDVPATEAEVAAASMAFAPPEEGSSASLSELIERTCVWCARAAGGGGGRGKGEAKGDRTADEFLVRSPGIWLHALQYSVNGATYRTELPAWGRFEGGEETAEERMQHG